MTEPWPDQLEVAFDPEALHRERQTAVRTLRITAWGWLALALAGSSAAPTSSSG
ncbi:hypothetical protein [Kribbella sp. CA-294648]|uniref:hypothetical protein n=1 Tax=Kribbella sp. CA-294648 TaxID=3239948 RepID=UPI003D941F99